ncbi:MAG: hypothetical protein WCG78_07835 [Candidatus Omnitrophota bacterium]
MSLRKELPLGLNLLRIFYALNALLFFISSAVFAGYLTILICGRVIPDLWASAARIALLALPLYLIVGISRLRKDAYLLALAYHAFFIVNAASELLCLSRAVVGTHPLFEIALKPEYRSNQIGTLLGPPWHIYLVHLSAAVIGGAFIAYLIHHRNLFTGGSARH